MSNKISIYVAYHRPSAVPAASNIHIPIHVGKALSDTTIEGTIGDDTGDNISELNPKYCEITATYWAWKNDTQSDYIGICHYRRFFSFEKSNPFSVAWRTIRFSKHKIYHPDVPYIYYNRIRCSTPRALQHHIEKFEKRLVDLLETRSVDIICLQPTKCNVELEKSGTVKNQDVRRAAKQYFADFYPYIDQIYRSHEFTCANMVIMKREIFDEYCALLFGFIDKLRQNGYTEQEEVRCYGYIAENVTAAFVEQKRAQGLNVLQLPSIFYAGK